MRIVNDCVKENTLFLEINGTCQNVSQLFINIRDRFIQLTNRVETLEKCCKGVNERLLRVEKCCKSNSDRISKLEEYCRRIQGNIFSWNPPVFYPGTGGTTLPRIISNIEVESKQKMRKVPFDFRGLEFRRVHGDPPDKFGPKNTKYYTEKELSPLRARLKKLGYKKYM